jgi:DNA-binding NarL/FixJ family response regulator
MSGQSKSTPSKRQRAARSPAEYLGLSPRQGAVLEAVSRGLLDKEIVGELHMSLGTLRSHMVVIFGRIGARNRAEAAARYGAASQKCLGSNDDYRARPERRILVG